MGRAPEVPGLCGISSKWKLRTQINLSLQLCVLFLMVLIGISPNYCSGAFLPRSRAELTPVFLPKTSNELRAAVIPVAECQSSSGAKDLKMRKVVHLVRHGQAAHNVRAEDAKERGCSNEKYIQLMREDDATDADLTEIGRKQARDAHLELMRAHRPVRPQLVVASPLSRALETAQLVFPRETSGDSDSIFVSLESLRERNRLLLNGQRRPVKQLQLKFPGVDFSDIEPGPDPTSTEELESVEHCALRGYESLQWVAERSEQEVAVVAHGALFEAMLNHSPLVQAEAEVARRFENCEVKTCVLEQDGEVLRLRLLKGDQDLI